jgi:hypothetical protein
MTPRARTPYLQTTVITLGLLLASPAVAGDPPMSGLTGPRIRTEPEIADFGYMPQGVFVSHTYWLKNPGTEPVRITKLATNCGCTQAPLTDSVIAVGDSIPVRITYGSRGMIGAVEKFTRIYSNANGRVPVLTLRAFVMTDSTKPPPVVATPPSVSLDPVSHLAGNEWNVPVTLKNTGRTVLTARVVDLPDGGSTAEPEAPLPPGQSGTFHIRFPRIEKATDHSSVTFEISDEARSHLTVPLMVPVPTEPE